MFACMPSSSVLHLCKAWDGDGKSERKTCLSGLGVSSVALHSSPRDSLSWSSELREATALLSWAWAGCLDRLPSSAASLLARLSEAVGSKAAPGNELLLFMVTRNAIAS